MNSNNRIKSSRNIIKTLTGRKSQCDTLPTQINLNSLPSNSNNIPDSYNKYFLSVADSITSNILNDYNPSAKAKTSEEYLRLCHFPIQSKLAQIVMISKPGPPPPPTEVTLYRPISLLPTMAKVSERLLLSRIEEAVPLNKLIPPYQFGFRENHLTAQLCHRIINKIRDSLEAKKKVCFSFS
jgi:hypothetical protein